MSILFIPTDDGTNPFYSQTTTLDGVTFTLSFAYNQRCDCWYLSIATLEGEDIINGVKLVCSWDLLTWSADPRKPAGRLIVFPNSPDTSPPGLRDFGDGGRCQLVYADAAEVASMIAAGLIQ